MDRSLAVVLTAIVGGGVALQAPINSYLGKHVGTFQAAFVSFAVGTVALFVIASFAKGGLGGLRHVTEPPWYYLTGGLLGLAYVTTVLVTVRTLGAGGVTAATVAGQLTTAMVIDRLGVLGLSETPITAARVVGVILLFAGTALVIKT